MFAKLAIPRKQWGEFIIWQACVAGVVNTKWIHVVDVTFAIINRARFRKNARTAIAIIVDVACCGASHIVCDARIRLGDEVCVLLIVWRANRTPAFACTVGVVVADVLCFSRHGIIILGLDAAAFLSLVVQRQALVNRTIVAFETRFAHAFVGGNVARAMRGPAA